METITKPAGFGRSTEAKYRRFRRWLDTPHGKNVYGMFTRFAEMYRRAGHGKCGANLIGNRVRWETDVGEYTGHKITNDFLPMLARQLALDDASFNGFFRFHADPEGVEDTGPKAVDGNDPEHDYDDNA